MLRCRFHALEIPLVHILIIRKRTTLGIHQFPTKHPAHHGYKLPSCHRLSQTKSTVIHAADETDLAGFHHFVISPMVCGHIGKLRTKSRCRPEGSHCRRQKNDLSFHTRSSFAFQNPLYKKSCMEPAFSCRPYSFSFLSVFQQNREVLCCIAFLTALFYSSFFRLSLTKFLIRSLFQKMTAPKARTTHPAIGAATCHKGIRSA